MDWVSSDNATAEVDYRWVVLLQPFVGFSFFFFFFVMLAAVGCVLLIEVNDHTLKDRNVEGTGAGEPHPNPRISSIDCLEGTKVQPHAGLG